MKIVLSFFTLITLALLPATANKPAGGRAAPGVCKADIEKFCGAHKGNRKAMKDCVNANKGKFSAECQAMKSNHKANKADRKARFDRAMEVCQKDIQQFCVAEQKKKGQSIRCLMKNREKVSAECKTALPEKRVKKEK